MSDRKTHTWDIVKSDIRPSAAPYVPLLEASVPHFLLADVEEWSDKYTVTCFYPENYYEWEDIRSQRRSEQLRAMLNLAELANLLQGRFTFELSPQTLVFTHNLEPLIRERGIKNAVPPLQELTPSEFLYRYKAMAVDLIGKESDYATLVKGNLDIYEGTPFERELLTAASLEEAVGLINRHYQEEKREEERLLVLTNRRSLQAKHIGLLTASILAVLLTAVAIYLFFFQRPLQNRLITANEYYLQREYSNVVSTLDDVSGTDLPRGSKYVMAYSVIQTEPLTNAQKTNLLDQLNIQMNEDYLLFWTEIGKGNNEEALDIATYLDEPQIIIYALSKKIEEIQNNPNLSSEERASQINTYQGQLDELNETYNREPEETSSLEQSGQSGVKG